MKDLGRDPLGLKWVRTKREDGGQILEALDTGSGIRLSFWRPVAFNLVEYLDSRGF